MLARSERIALKSSNTTLLPFLYHTSTIQRPRVHQSGATLWRQVSEQSNCTGRYSRSRHSQPSEPIQNSNITTVRPRRQPDIPFERPPPKKDPYSELELEGSTITPNERKAFEGLFNLQRKAVPAKAIPPETKVGGNLSGNGARGARTILGRRRRLSRVGGQAAGAQRSASQTDIATDAETQETWSTELSPALLALAKQARLKQSGATPAENTTPDSRESSSNQRSAKPRISAAAQRELNVISNAFQHSKSDAEIWQILQSQVFKPLSDQLQTFSSRHDTTAVALASIKSLEEDEHLRNFKETLPQHLTNTFKYLKSHYPSSLLPLAILPALRRLGPLAIALGGSTALYTLHAREHWRRYQASGVNDIAVVLKSALAEGTVDSETVAVLDGILDYESSARRGAEGEGVRVLWAMERTRSAVAELVRLRTEIVKVVEESALRAAFEMEAGRAESESGNRVETRM